MRQILEPLAIPRGFVVDTEYPYRPLPESEVWGGDVVCFQELREPLSNKWLAGSPELVIEVKSPANTNADLQDRAMTTLAGEGAIEFWVVDAKAGIVKVYSKTSGVRIYSATDDVPVALLQSHISLAELFAGLK